MTNHPSNDYYYIDNRFIHDGWAREVGPYAAAVYNVLLSFAGDDGDEAPPAPTTIAELLGCSRKKVVDSIARLEQLNLIHRCRQSHRYTLLPPEQWRWPAEMSG